MARTRKSKEVQKLEYDTIDRFLPDRVDRNDPRYLEAAKFYDETRHGTRIIKLYKTTRAGATVSLSSESIRRGKLLTLVCRTNRVITETMKADVAHHTAKYGKCDIIHITRNSFCPKLMKLIEAHPQLERLGVFPLPNCDKCDVSLKECPIKYAYETPAKEVGVYCITYAKLLSLMLSSSKRVSNLLSKILLSRNFIFDEAQYLQEADANQVAIWQKTKDQETDIRKDFTKKYEKLTESPRIAQLVEEISILLERITPSINEIKTKSREERFKKHLSITIVNPVYEAIIGTLDRMYKETPHLIPPVKDFRDIMKTQSLLMRAIINPEKFGVNENDIITLSSLLFILASTRVTISYVKSLDCEEISLRAENSILYNVLKKTLKSLLDKNTDRRIFFTSATFGSFSLEALYQEELSTHDLKIESRFWGKNGDPMGTCSKSLVITDKAKVSPYNFRKRKQAILNLISAVAQKYGRENIQILTMNKAWAKSLLAELEKKGFTKDDVTWYGSDKTEGVKSRRRIWISVGLAQKPSNAKDHLAETQAPYHENPLGLEGEELYHFISQTLREESVHISTYQAISRAKDPNSKDRSLVIAIGTTKKEAEDCITWGTRRRLVPKITKRGYNFEVSVDELLSKPNLTQAPLTTDLTESTHIIDQWLNYGKIVGYKLNWVYLKKLVDQRGYISLKRLVNNYGFPETETQNLLDELPQLFAKQGISDHIILKTPEGKVKGVATLEHNKNLTKARILLYKEKSQNPVVHLDWFIALSSAIDRAPANRSAISSKYFNRHVSTNHYLHVNECFDILQDNHYLCPGWIVIGEKDKERETRRLIRDVHCLSSWAPEFPRRFGSPTQVWVNNYSDLTQSITNSLDAGLDAFISVYSFPEHHHPMDGGNPPISTVFIDLDIESSELSDLRRRWDHGDKSVVDQLLVLRMTLLNEVLKQAKALVGYLVRQNIQPRMLLSGFKGAHIFIDFPSVQFSSPEIAKSTITTFLDEINTRVAQDSNVQVNFDTSVIGDLSRLCRVPNTANIKATKLLGRPQYAVPVTVDAFLKLTPEVYDKLCSSPRYIPMARNESHEVLVMLTRITENMELDEVAVTPKTSVKDPERLEKYERECTKEILTDEDFEELNLRPCFKKVRRQKLSLDGSGGHKMRIGAVMELASQELSIPSIVRWFDFCSDYDPDITEASVKSIISRGYTDEHLNEFGRQYRKGLKCTTIQRCGFCLGASCNIYRRKFMGGKSK